MPTPLRREPATCSLCQLPFTVLHTNHGATEGATIEYDVAEWTRLCRHPGVGSPMVCPGMGAVVKAWLGRR